MSKIFIWAQKIMGKMATGVIIACFISYKKRVQSRKVSVEDPLIYFSDFQTEDEEKSFKSGEKERAFLHFLRMYYTSVICQ